MTHAVLQERKATQSIDVLSSMFSAGSMDPTKLPIHPCPPGRKDGTMKTNLMEFQVCFLLYLSRSPRCGLSVSAEGYRDKD